MYCFYDDVWTCSFCPSVLKETVICIWTPCGLVSIFEFMVPRCMAQAMWCSNKKMPQYEAETWCNLLSLCTWEQLHTQNFSMGSGVGGSYPKAIQKLRWILNTYKYRATNSCDITLFAIAFTHTHTHIYIYIYMYVCIYICCLFSWRYNPLWLYFHSPVAGFSFLVFEVFWSHITTRHIR